MNNTLNNPLYGTVTNLVVTTSGTYKFELKDRNGRTVFVGNCWLNVGDTSKTFYLNDMLKNERWIPEEIATTPERLLQEVKIFTQYYLTVYIDGQEFVRWLTPILLAHDYPHYKKELDIELMNWEDANNQNTLVLMQGAKPNQAPPFISNIPLIDTTEIGFGIVFEDCAGMYNKPSIYINSMSTDGGFQFKQITTKYVPCGSFYYNLHKLLFADGSPITGDNPWLRFDASYKVADIDKCYKKYYLLWQDRYGTFVMKGFDKKEVFAEDITTTTLTDYTGQNKVINKTITPTFNIKSGVITNAEIPYYESIFTSPYLRLYDTENDKGYNVIVTNKSFTEKSNLGSKLFQLSLDLELDKQQMVY